MRRYRADQHLIVLNLYSLNYVTLKVSQNLNLMQKCQHSKINNLMGTVHVKHSKHSNKQNIRKQIDRKRTSSAKQTNRAQNICIEIQCK